MASNVTGTIAISNGGSGATTAGGARTNLGLGTTNSVVFREVATDGFKAFSDSGGFTEFYGPIWFEDSGGTNDIFQFETGAADQAVARTNLGLGLSALTNANTTNFRTAIGLGATNSVLFSNISASGYISIGNSAPLLKSEAAGVVGFYDSVDSEYILSMPSDSDDVVINAQWNNAGVRSNLGLGWSALINSNAGTGLVSVSTNGEVVSPTNFWQVAPIVTRFIESQPIASQTTNITAARNLHIHSIAISTTNVTNTIALPITNSFDGDIALIVHQGPTSSVTAVRTAGAATNLVTMNQFEQTVEFVYYNSVWQFNHNQSFIEPIFFSGNNSAANAEASRTNLGLGWPALTNAQSTLYSGQATRLLGYAPEITAGTTNLTGFNVLAYTNTNGLVIPANILIGEDQAPAPRNTRNVTVNGSVTIQTPFSSPKTIYANNSITATDDSSYTNTLVTFNSNSVSSATNLVVNGFVDFTTNRTNNNPAAGANFSDRSRWLQVKIGTNNFYIPLFQ